MKGKLKKIFILIVIVIIFVFSLSISFTSGDNDPLVTLSYLEKRINEMKDYIDYKIFDSGNRSAKFEVVEIHAGKKIVFKDASLEFILRSGKASAIASDLGGLSDLTTGNDLKTGDLIQKNHLMLVPRDDDRGVNILENNTFIMIKGNYEIRNGE